jgi:hypothetical protein
MRRLVALAPILAALLAAAPAALAAEPMPDDAFGLLVRLSAFALVIAAAALTPAPVKAAHLEA